MAALLVLGRLSDHIGRRPVIVAAIFAQRRLEARLAEEALPG